ncbi:MAG: hypothetical protein O3A53_21040, partial [Acidobacteria bacterium]|nr:hypothetical protein [Acidobacteriota bacterium]
RSTPSWSSFPAPPWSIFTPPLTAEVTLVLVLEATGVGHHDGAAEVGEFGSVASDDFVQPASLAKPLEITALDRCIPYRDALRT